MSSAAVEFPAAGLRPGPGARPRRAAGHLRLVPADERAPRRSTLRITRRGRLALTGTITLVIALVVLSLVGSLGPAGASSAVVVEPGMTLTQIAALHLPDVPLTQAISDIQQVNRLSTTSIAAGQELVIPGR